FLLQNLLDDAGGDLRRSAEIGVLVVFQRAGNAGDAKECAFNRRGDRAGIEHINAGVESAVEAADDDIGPLATKLKDAELDAVRRAALDSPTSQPLAVIDLLSYQWRKKCNRMGDAALLCSGCNHDDIAQAAQLGLQGLQPGSVDAVVVGKQDQHAFDVT